MTQILPQNTVSPLQSYTRLFYTDNSTANLDAAILAAATNTFGYAPGCILAQYTSGAHQGKFVNYVPSASNGQGVPVAVLSDDYLIPIIANGTGGTPIGVGGPANIVYGSTQLFLAPLYWTSPGNGDDITTVIGYGAGKIQGKFWGGVQTGTAEFESVILF